MTSNIDTKNIKTKKPLISVIITNFNYADYVEKAIKSVLTQTYPNIELIIINDGSTDDSDKIIKKVIRKNLDRNIIYINRANRGIVYTRNQGLKIAKGEFISYLDADDYFNSDYISKSFKIADKYNADVVYPNWLFVGDWLGRPDTNFQEFSPALLQLQKLHVTPASLIRVKAIGNHRFEAEKVAEDWDFFIGLSLDGVNFKLAKDNYINYRIRSGTRSSKNTPKEDTKYFVEILKKYKTLYGDKVINPSKLVSYRHPNTIMKILRMQLPRTIIESIKRDGGRATTRKIFRKVASRSQKTTKVFWHLRNKKYQKISKNIKITKSYGTKLAVIVHLYYTDSWLPIKERLSNIGVPFDLFVSLQEKDKNIDLGKVNSNHKLTNIFVYPNRGRDVLPFLLIARLISENKHYAYVLKIHSKKSLHRDDGEEWLKSLLNELIPNNTDKIISKLEDPNTGAIGPKSHVVSLSRYMGGNKHLVYFVLTKITNKKIASDIISNQGYYPFFGGTMFWCRIDFLSPLLKSDLTPADFNSESKQVDATTAHAIERVLGKILHKIANKKMYIIEKSEVRELAEKKYSSYYKHV